MGGKDFKSLTMAWIVRVYSLSGGPADVLACVDISL